MTDDNSYSSPRSPYRLLIRLIAFVLLLLVAYRFYEHTPVPAQSELRRFAAVPPFALTERSGKTITNADLKGKIWVADFIYTTCPGPCPLVTAGMAKIQRAVSADKQVQLVTFTVDPQTDTPAVLAAYAHKFGADANRWWFLTGAEKPLYELIQNGFYQVVQDNRGQPPAEGQFTVTHSTKLVLVDADGVMRGFYDGVDSDGRVDLLKGIRTLEKEETQ